MCALVTGVQTCALPISLEDADDLGGLRVDLLEQSGEALDRRPHQDARPADLLDEVLLVPVQPLDLQQLVDDSHSQAVAVAQRLDVAEDRKSTRLNSSH